MPLKKMLFKPGINRENTRYATEGGWYDCDKVRFRQGTAEKIGGWVRYSQNLINGTCRKLFNWVTLGGQKLLGVGTTSHYYIENGGVYYDVTPARFITAAGGVTFSASFATQTITVNDAVTAAIRQGDYVVFSGALDLGGGITADFINQEFEIGAVSAGSYELILPPNSPTIPAATGTGGPNTVATYLLSTGAVLEVPVEGWGAGAWGAGTWGVGVPSDLRIRIWNQANFGQDLIFGLEYGGLFYWSASTGVTSGVRAIPLVGTNVPTAHNQLIVSDVSRYVMCFGCNPVFDPNLDPMLIRWSDQENPYDWLPTATNQSGELRLSLGSSIIAVQQQRQEILVWTDTALYSLQYLGAPLVWGATLLGENTSIMSSRAVAAANNVTYWMGADKFYIYDGRVQTLRCDVRQYVFNNNDAVKQIDLTQSEQVFAGTVEAFNEIWWFYCSTPENAPIPSPDRYVVYNYAEDIWYFGTMERTAWLDSKVARNPTAATSIGYLISQENGPDNVEGEGNAPLPAYIESSEFDLDDGHNFGFVGRVLPDITFRGSTSLSPRATFTLIPQQNSGSGATSPESTGGVSGGQVVRTVAIPVEQYTGQINTRVRGRQLSMRIESDSLGTAWQVGAPRIDIRPDGRR
jgi:hypothetical protein